jgi:signal peptidase II
MTIKKAFLATAGITLFLISADRITKILSETFLRNGLRLLPFIDLKVSRNVGIAWSINVPLFILIPLDLVLLGLIFWLAFRHLDIRKNLSIWITALVLGGAVGNIIDRIIRGAVTDFISIGFWPVFNLADAFLTIGIFLGIVFYGKIKKNPDI